MIYFTGDTHGDFERLSKNALGMMKPHDTLIVCGDFGFIWTDSKQEQKILTKLSKRPYNICLVDGTHENFESLSAYSTVLWNGGLAHKIRDNIFHLMRGEIYEIEGKKIFTMGGGEDPDMELQEDEEITTHKEIPTSQDMMNGVNNMERYQYKVDYIVTHEPPAKTRDFLLLSSNEILRVTALGAYLDELSQQTEYSRWFFGSMHIDRFISDSQVALFKNIVSAQTGRKPKSK